MQSAGGGGGLHLRATLSSASSQTTGRCQYSSAANDERDLIQAISKLHSADQRLKKAQRQEVVQASLAQGEEALLQRIKERLDRSGYEWPGVEVVYNAVSVERRAVTVAESLPSLVAPLTRLFRAHTPSTIKALDNITGVLKPGSMTLVLGPPGSGRSTYMKVLSGRLRGSKMVTIQGSDSIRFNGQACDQFVMQRTAAYVDQVDKLIPTLTCRETLNFSETCAGDRQHLEAAVRRLMTWEAAHPQQATRNTLDEEADKLMLRMLRSHNLMQTEYALSVLGLTHAGDTVVGDAVLRGVSGGEKRRVAVGEGLVSSTMVVMLDEASTGLDSASTLGLTQSMRRWAKLLNTTVVMALLQPEPAVVAQFDDILLLAEGKVLWHGPISGVLGHFTCCGLRPLPGQDLSEFLTQVVSPADQAGLRDDSAGGSSLLTPTQLSNAFWESQTGVELQAAVQVEMTPNETQLASLDTRKQGAPWHVLLRACTARLFKVDFARNWEACAIRWTLALFMGIITGTLFLQLPVTFTGGVNLLGLLFQALFFVQVLSVPTIEVTFEKRPILFRQRDELFYPAWVEWLPAVLLNVPVLLMDTLVYGTPVYFMVGFAPTAAAFFTFLLILAGFSLMCDNLYRVYGGASKVLSFAIGIGVCHGIINEMLAGFVITPGAIPSYWYWMYWLNPLAYAFRAMALNEFKQARWAIPSGTPGTPGADVPLGVAVLDLFQIHSDTWTWVWGGVGVLLGMAAFCAVCSLLAYTYSSLKENAAVMSAQQQQDEQQRKQLQSTKAAVGRQQQQSMKDTSSQRQQSGGAAVLELAAAAGDKGATTAAGCSLERGIAIAFKELCYYVPDPAGGKQELQLLHDVTASFRPGVLTALMGSSGAGKTTLMDVIAQRKTSGRITGTIFVDGHPQEQVAFARLTGYVEQSDIHVPLTTVREALAFSAALRAPRGASRPSLVSRVLDMVELTPLADRMVGTPGVNGLSTEQRKRLTIAVELVAAPLALFLDEPTSGLDTRSAAVIAGVMRAISQQGVTVVATIHQPSQAIFRQFDELLLLKRGGRVVFYGPLGLDACHLVDYFQGLPGVPACKQVNPAAWMLEVVGGPAALLPGYPDLAAAYTASNLAKVAYDQVEALCHPPLKPSGGSQLEALNPGAPTSSSQQLGLLLRRNLSCYWRNPATNLSRFAVTLVIALIVGSIEWGKGNPAKIHDARGVQNSLGALYMIASALSVEVGFECQSGLAKERVVYTRERSAACYGAAPYLFAQALAEVMYVSVQVLLYTIITYFMLQFELVAAKFFYVLVLVWLACVVAFLTSQALVHTTRVVFIATTVYSVLSNLQGLTSGFSRPLPATPPAWWGAYFLNPSFYTFVGIGSQMLGDVSSITIPSPANGKPIAVNDYVAGLYSMSLHSFPGPYGSMGMLAAIGGVLLAISFCGLKYGVTRR